MSGKNKKTKRLKNNIRHAVLVLALLVLIISGLMFMQAWEKNRGVYSDSDSTEVELTYEGKSYVPNESVESFLVLGLDKYDDYNDDESYNNDKQADFLMLFVFDNEAKKCTGIHINRDTMADVSVLGVAGNIIDTVTRQIALAHTYGNGKDVSCRNTADSVSALLGGVKVNHYISVTMDSVDIINDYVGGVEVKLNEDLTLIDKSFVKGATVTLRGEKALEFVRTRYGLDDSSNIARMKRQRQYIEALYSKIVSLSEKDEEFAMDALLEMSEHIVSDRSISQMQELADKFIEYDFEGIRVIEGDNTVGEKYMEFYADDKSVKDIVFDLFYKEKTK